jgi:glycosyltransferase A (GT-A) superfamily protein (DUF2064 family)
VLFARLPERGKVKTRLAEDLDENGAYEMYLWLLRVQARAIARDVPAGHRVSTYIYYAPDVNRISARAKFHPHLKGLDLKFRPQGAGDLGARLKAAASEVLKSHDLALIWGADIPTLPQHIFSQGAALYPQSVITLAHDGGYAFLSLAKEHFTPAIFDNIRWSTVNAGRDQLRALTRAGVPVVVSGKVADLDRAKDFTRIVRELEAHERIADLEDLTTTLQSLSSALPQDNFIARRGG